MKKGFLTLLVTALLILTACGQKEEGRHGKLERPQVKGVKIAAVEKVTVKEYYDASGTVKAKNTALVSSKVMGEVKEILVKEGQRVKKGDILLRISSPDIDAKVNQALEALEEAKRGVRMAEENLALMEKTFQRYSKLYEGKAITEQEFDEIKTKREITILRLEQARKTLKRAEASVKEAEAFRDYTVIKSPVSGVVADKMIDVGSMAAPGVPLFIIEEPYYRVEVPVDETLQGIVKPGMEVDVFIDSIGYGTKGRVSEIVHRIDPATRSFIVKVDINKTVSGLRGGLYSTVKIPVSETRRLLIPLSALIERGEVRGVYVVDQKGIIKMRLIRTGKERNGMIEVLSGLNEGERIIVDGLEYAVDGGIVVSKG